MRIRLFCVVRKERWHDKLGSEISQEEWSSYLQKDTSFERTFVIGDGNFYIWKGPSKLKPALIDWRSGMLCTNSPDKALLEKMISVAKELGANVFDKEGNKYESMEDIPYNFDNEIDLQIEKRGRNIAELLAGLPRCLKDFVIVDRGANEFFRGGHGEELNIGYQVKCKNCDSKSLIIGGYYWFNEHYKKEVFVGPISIQCCSCGKKRYRISSKRTRV